MPSRYCRNHKTYNCTKCGRPRGQRQYSNIVKMHQPMSRHQCILSILGSYAAGRVAVRSKTISIELFTRYEIDLSPRQVRRELATLAILGKVEKKIT